ncbi:MULTISPECIES: hypothetical protein [Enterocloster]|uniref:Uncharacterized protein n=1 Tax=Enterocloster lavalensis TaxID=460384 RepID=A0A1I0IL32_9FIRM|nr:MULTISPECIES: hypothetical protein [Enterocloster]RHR50831.1 hypothetical protein DWX10_18280 [Clostridium sp. AF18-27]MBS5605908.1 hypothetical protein [Enterocloster asparagiformis]MDR3759061.1 hypothetical protein [Enterocloster sp.]PST33625.1 hypothetical protein C7256_09600 [Enterocloster lavalensis]SET97784.1 hypothetical protein SAMN05216313_12235 [Enterocloster lavalensis]
MICLLVFICCLAAVTALTVGMVLKVVTTLVEAFLDIVVRYGVILICTALICLAVFILASMVIELIHGANILLLLLSLGLWVLSLGLAAFFASLIGSLAYLLIALACAAVMFLSDLLGELSMSLFNGMLGIMAKQSGRR